MGNAKEKKSIGQKLGVSPKRLGYGTGHILNDMCASMWFTYMLLFFHNVVELSNVKAGLIVLIGQIADGISTVLVGVLSDIDYDIWIYVKYGKRKVMSMIIIKKLFRNFKSNTAFKVFISII